jgi:hypothetical protein
VEDLGEDEQTALGDRLAAVCRGKTLKAGSSWFWGFEKLNKGLDWILQFQFIQR